MQEVVGGVALELLYVDCRRQDQTNKDMFPYSKMAQCTLALSGLWVRRNGMQIFCACETMQQFDQENGSKSDSEAS